MYILKLIVNIDDTSGEFQGNAEYIDKEWDSIQRNKADRSVTHV